MLFSLVSKTSHLLCNGFVKQSSRLVRNVTLLHKVRSNSILDKSQHKLVYDFPKIKLPVAVLRTKIWLPPVGLAMAPIFYIIDGTVITPVICVLSACVYGLTGVILSKLTENVVGKIYVNKEGDVKDVIISSVSKAGRRIDKIYHIEELINYDFPSRIHRSLGFITIGIENSTTIYKVNIQNCRLIDPGICMYLFGKIWPKNVIEAGRSSEKIGKKISNT